MKSIRRFTSLGPDDRALLLNAALLLTAARLCLWLLPWRFAIQMIRSLRIPRPVQFTAARAAWAIGHASRVVPRTTCLTQALALHHMLSRAGYASRIQVGVAKDGGNFEAHAWVEHQNNPLLNNASELTRYSRLLTLENF
ncbi:MAG: lasso peptide biosynthesis B2 protein [Candidatus Binataceae bacterium]